MELKQLRYFVRVAELGGFGRAAADLGLATSALSQQVSRLEGELATRLFSRTSAGVVLTDAGLAFMRQAQLVLRQADAAVQAAQQRRLSGSVSIGLAPTTGAVLGLPLMQAMRERYPDVKLHLVESLSGHLGTMLASRTIDLAVMFGADAGERFSVQPLVDERLFVIGLAALDGMPTGRRVRVERIASLPLILPSASHGLRRSIDAVFEQARIRPPVAVEIDSLALLMDAVRAGLGATIQPGAATARLADDRLVLRELAHAGATRRNMLASLSDDELAPAALAARVVLVDVARALARSGQWPGARLIER